MCKFDDRWLRQIVSQKMIVDDILAREHENVSRADSVKVRDTYLVQVRSQLAIKDGPVRNLVSASRNG
jgi:hypothetical protein